MKIYLDSSLNILSEDDYYDLIYHGLDDISYFYIQEFEVPDHLESEDDILKFLGLSISNNI